jgi:two-component system sensor histidine kinase KdpD
VADKVDEELNDYRERHNIAGPWETKERVVVSLTGSRGSTVLIRRAARMAMRIKAELVGVHVRTDDSQTGAGAQGLVQNRALLDDLGGRYVEVVGADVAPALVQVARVENATQLVMGATHRSRINEFVRGSVINSVIRAASGSLDVHVIATEAELEPASGDTTDEGPTDGASRSRSRPTDGSRGRYRPSLLSPLPVRRRVAALVIGIIGFPLLTLVLTAGRSGDSLATALSSYLVLVVVVAAIGGVWPAALAAIAGFLLSNYYFAPPIHSFTIADTRDILALVMFLVTAGWSVCWWTSRPADRRLPCRPEPTPACWPGWRVAWCLPRATRCRLCLEELMVAFRLDGASVLRTETQPESGDASTGSTWEVVASAGQQPPIRPDEASVLLPLTEREYLALRGPGLTAEDREILSAFAAQLATALESDRLHAEAAEADSLARANQLRRLCWPRSATTSGLRWRRSRPRRRACFPTSSPSDPRRPGSCSRPSTTKPTG